MCNEELHTQDLKPATDNNLIDALDRILIKCVRCGKTGLERGHFHDHKTKMCPKVDVLCRSSDLKCPWIGPRDQLDKHLNSCIFNLLRPLITELQNNNQRLTSRINQQETQIGELQNENQQLTSQVNEQKTQIGELQTRIND
jgi:FtsZ-binding cell division protein ZapB